MEGVRASASRLLCLLALLSLFLADAAGKASQYVGNEGMPIAYATTGVAVAHDQFRLSGKGQTIAIMDSGINYKHPALGACRKAGPGCRVRGGYDFVGENEKVDGGYRPDSDPMDCKTEEYAHGTEVASVAAGDASYDKRKPWRGVAYGASLLAYKVSGSCSDYGATVSTNATLRAIRAATAAGADVLNLSYGDFRSGAYVDGRYARALVAAMQQGAMVTIASGNDGYYGPWLTEGGVAAPGVISTAAVEVVLNITRVELRFDRTLSIAGRQQNTMVSLDASFLTTVTVAATGSYLAQQAALRLPLQVVHVQPLQACKDPITNKAALRGNIALVARGNCTFYEKAVKLAAAGAAGIIVYNNNKTDKFFFGMAFDDVPPVPIWAVSYDAGQALLAVTAAGGSQPVQQQQQQPRKVAAEKASRQQAHKQPKVELGVKLVGVRPLMARGYDLVVDPSAFSSWGPSATLELTPTLAAPGSGMYTATAGTSYTHVDGTSYSAPFVAGALALWRTTRPRIRPQPGRLVVTAAAGDGSSSSSRKQTVGRTTESASGSAGIKSASSSSSSSSPSSQQAVPTKSWVASTWESVKHSVFVTGFTAPTAPAAIRPMPTGAAGKEVDAASKKQAGVKAAGPRPADKTQGRFPLPSQRHGRGTNGPEEAVVQLVVGEAGSSDSAAGYAGQAAAYASFVTTAKPIVWHKQPGWAQPVARVGAGLIQVDAAIQNPTTITPNHLLLRSNRQRQSTTFTATNAAAFALTYRLGHTPAAAISMTDTWFQDDPEELMKAWTARVSFLVQGKAAQQVTLSPGGSATVEVTFELPSVLFTTPALYSGYITLTPFGAAPAAASQQLKALQKKQQQQAQALSRSGRQWQQLEEAVATSVGVQDPVPFAAVPLVLPYQGFSTNYSTLPILPEPNSRSNKEQSRQLKGLLRVCYSDFAHDDSASRRFRDDPDAMDNQDGFLYQPHVDRCLMHAGDASGLTKLPLADIEEGYGAIIIGAALLRPALSMQLMLFEAEPPARCTRAGKVAAAAAAAASKPSSSKGRGGGVPPKQPLKQPVKAAAGASVAGALPKQPVKAAAGASVAAGCTWSFKRGKLVGEVWRYKDPSRDFPGVLWAYYNESFEGQVALRSAATQKVVARRRVALATPYKMQLWVTGPLAAVDRAAGEQYHVFKYDVPGTFIFV